MNEVFVAVRQNGCVGYFARLDDVPKGWKLSEIRDITDVMTSMRCTLGQALKIMNSHWT